MTEKHYQLIQEYYSATNKETKDKLDKKIGVYGIYCDDKLIYVGKSTNLLNRFIAHKAHIFCSESKEHNSRKYAEMRKALQEGHQIRCDVLEYCSKGNLSECEDKWIAATLPALNTVIPAANGKHTTKSVTSIL